MGSTGLDFGLIPFTRGTHLFFKKDIYVSASAVNLQAVDMYHFHGEPPWPAGATTSICPKRIPRIVSPFFFLGRLFQKKWLPLWFPRVPGLASLFFGPNPSRRAKAALSLLLDCRGVTPQLLDPKRLSRGGGALEPGQNDTRGVLKKRAVVPPFCAFLFNFC